MAESGRSGTLRIAIVAGEPSGDQLAAPLMQTLRELCPEVRFEGIGGEAMQARGLECLWPMDRLAVMGLFEVLGRVPELWRLRRELAWRWSTEPPDLFIGIDAPDFNLGLERALHEAGIATIHYVSPTVWAWRRYRMRAIARSVSHMLTLFPFETGIYRQHGVPVTCVGHPLARSLPVEPVAGEYRRRLELYEGGRWLALLPGSRRQEWERHLEPFLEAARLLRRRYHDLRFVMPLVNEGMRQQVAPVVEQRFAELPLVLVQGRSHEVMAAADLVLTVSGTATLEAMLLQRPMVAAYRLSRPSYLLARALVRLRWFSLPNLLAGEELVPELLQDQVNPAGLANAVSGLLESPDRCGRLRERFGELRRSLDLGGSELAARVALELAGR